MIKRIVLIYCFFFLFIGLGISQITSDSLNFTDKAGKKQGVWKKKYSNGIIKYEGFFENNQPKGEFKYYYEDGSKKAISIFWNNGIRSFTKTFFPNGKIMSEGYYLNEKKDSTWKYYNGFDVVIREEFYKNNLKNGEWKTYYPDGSLTDKVTWKNGIKDGPWEQNYSGGTLKTQFKNNKLEGLYQVFTFDGKLKSQGKYINDKKEGIWYWYDTDALPVKKFMYKNDILISKELLIYENKKAVGINYDNIAFFYTKNEKTILVKSDNSQVFPNAKINSLFELLGEDYFLQINKNFIANYNSIKGVTPFEVKFYKVQLLPDPGFEIISEEESTKALRSLFNDFK